MPYGITQCYLPPGRGDIPAFTPAKAVHVVSKHVATDKLTTANGSIGGTFTSSSAL